MNLEKYSPLDPVIGFTATPAMARLGMDLNHAQPPAEAAQEGLESLANGSIT